MRNNILSGLDSMNLQSEAHWGCLSHGQNTPIWGVDLGVDLLTNKPVVIIVLFLCFGSLAFGERKAFTSAYNSGQSGFIKLEGKTTAWPFWDPCATELAGPKMPTLLARGIDVITKANWVAAHRESKEGHVVTASCRCYLCDTWRFSFQLYSDPGRWVYRRDGSFGNTSRDFLWKKGMRLKCRSFEPLSFHQLQRSQLPEMLPVSFSSRIDATDVSFWSMSLFTYSTCILNC